MIFFNFSQNIHCGYTSESNEYPRPRIWIRYKKNRLTPSNLSFTYKSGVQWGIQYVHVCLRDNMKCDIIIT